MKRKKRERDAVVSSPETSPERTYKTRINEREVGSKRGYNPTIKQRRQPGLESRNPDMYRAFDGSALICLGSYSICLTI
jgi:hypothetical protein